MGFSGALFAMSGAQAVSQIAQGYSQKAEANYNATLLEGKAQQIELARDIENAQYDRLKGKYMSKAVSNIAASGIGMQGSAVAVMIDTQAQISIDQAIANFGHTQEKNYTIAEANAQRRAGKAAVRSGYTNAFSTLLTGASNYAMYKTPMKKDTTFDVSTNSKLKGSIPKRQPAGYIDF